MDKERVEILLNKLLPVIIPKEVVDIVFDVHHTSPNEFTLHAVFVVSDKLWDSYDPINKAALEHTIKVKLRQKINNFLISQKKIFWRPAKICYFGPIFAGEKNTFRDNSKQFRSYSTATSNPPCVAYLLKI